MRDAGLKVCCGGIVGMGETARDRAELLRTLANLPEHPESVPINQLVQVPGTPLRGRRRTSIPSTSCAPSPWRASLMPRAHVRLSAGREAMSDELQALCFLAGANSIFYGEKLLTTGNPGRGARPAAVRAPGPARRSAPAPAASARAGEVAGAAAC